LNNNKNPEEICSETGLTGDQLRRVFRDINTKRRTTLPLHMKPLLLEPIPEIQY